METISKRVRIGRGIYLVLAIIFALSLTMQFLLAGMAIFISQVNWVKHMTFVHLFGFNIPIFMLVAAFIGRLPRHVYWQMLGILLSVFLMYFSANFTGQSPWIGALHPVIGVILFIFSYSTVVGTFKYIKQSKESNDK